MVVTKEGVGRAIERISEQLAHQERSHIKFRTLVTLVGHKKTSASLVETLEKAIAEAGFFHFPATLKNCQLKDTVLISVKPFRDPGLPFADEGEVAEFLVRHYKLLAPFSRCTSVVRERRCGKIRIDLCFRERGGGYVVCELKHGSGRFEIATQIETYIEELNSELVNKGQKPSIRGVVVTGKENPNEEAKVAEWSQKSGFPVDWYYYRLSLELEAAPL